MFSEALLLHSLNTYNAGWITRVLLHKPEAHSKHFSVICIDYSYIYVWNIDGQQKVRGPCMMVCDVKTEGFNPFDAFFWK